MFLYALQEALLRREQRGDEQAEHPCTFTYIYIYAFSRRFIQSDLQLHSGYTFFHQYLCSLGIEPTTLCAANAMLYH